MATATAHVPFNSDTFTVWVGTVTVATATQFQVTSGAQVQNWFGSGFTFGAQGQITGGTVTSTTYLLNGVLQYEVTGLNHSAATIFGHAISGNSQGLLSFLFNGNDTFAGSGGDDVMNGFALNDSIVGGAGNDVGRGNEGDDTLDGGSGADTGIGGSGNDVYYVDNAGDVVTENPPDGLFDEVRSTISYTLPSGVENLTLLTIAGGLVGPGPSGTGNELNNSITGNAGANTLDGGIGNDTLAGGAGNDVYYVDSSMDVVTETSGGGTDEVRATFSFNLANSAFVENLTLLGPASNGTGNDERNVITGTAQANVLDGGANADTLVGGAGADIFHVDNVGDVVVELAGEGTDTVRSSAMFTVLADNVELLELTGSLSADANGNVLDNVMTGNAGNNRLYGFAGNDTLTGGEGVDVLLGMQGNDSMEGGGGNDILFAGDGGSADILRGGGGNDLYVLYSDGSTITEFPGVDPADTILSHAAFTALAANVEYLVLDALAGNAGANGTNANDTLIGNASANAFWAFGGDDLVLGGDGSDILMGMDGNDVLYAGSGLWTDALIGGAGDDVYELYNGGATVSENAGEGTDTVRSGAAYTILSDNVEKLVLLDAINSGANGNALANTMTGNPGNNSLYGFGGNDTLLGGDGADLLFGMDGNDVLNGGGGPWVDLLVGGAGDDYYEVSIDGTQITENAGEGTDTVLSRAPFMTLAANVEYVVLDPSAGNAGANGSSGNDILIGNASGNGFWAFGGDDLMLGGDGSDVLLGMDGNDVMYAGSGLWTDLLIGGAGDDVYELYNAASTVTENPGEGTDTVRSGAGYTILWDNVEKLVLLDSLNSGANGNALDNTLTGNAGSNSLYGFGGNDTVSGGDGADVLLGMDGNDLLSGGAGNDVHYGGAGIDTIDFNSVAEGVDAIADFTPGAGGDKLDIRDLLVGYDPGTSAIGDFVQLSEAGGSTTVAVDANGTVGGGTFTPIVSLQGVTGLVLNDLLANGNLIVS